MTSQNAEPSAPATTLELLREELAKEVAALPASLQSTNPTQFVDYLATVFKVDDDRQSLGRPWKLSHSDSDGVRIFTQALQAEVTTEEAKSKALKLKAMMESVSGGLSSIYKTSFPAQDGRAKQPKNGAAVKLNLVSCNACNRTVLAHRFALHLTTCAGQDHRASPAPSRTSTKAKLSRLMKQGQVPGRRARGSTAPVGPAAKSRLARSSSGSKFDLPIPASVKGVRAGYPAGQPLSLSVSDSFLDSPLSDDQGWSFPQQKRSERPRKKRKLDVTGPPWTAVSLHYDPPSKFAPSFGKPSDMLVNGLGGLPPSQPAFAPSKGCTVPVVLEGSPEHARVSASSIPLSQMAQPPGVGPQSAGLTAHSKRILAAKAKTGGLGHANQVQPVVGLHGSRLPIRHSNPAGISKVHGVSKTAQVAKPKPVPGVPHQAAQPGNAAPPLSGRLHPQGHRPAVPAQRPMGPVIHNPLVPLQPRKVPMHLERARPAAVRNQQLVQAGQARPQAPQAGARPGTRVPTAFAGASAPELAVNAALQRMSHTQPSALSQKQSIGATRSGIPVTGVASGQTLERLAASRQLSGHATSKQPVGRPVSQSSLHTREPPSLNLMDFMYPSRPPMSQQPMSQRPVTYQHASQQGQMSQQQMGLRRAAAAGKQPAEGIPGLTPQGNLLSRLPPGTATGWPRGAPLLGAKLPASTAVKPRPQAYLSQQHPRGLQVPTQPRPAGNGSSAASLGSRQALYAPGHPGHGPRSGVAAPGGVSAGLPRPLPARSSGLQPAVLGYTPPVSQPARHNLSAQNTTRIPAISAMQNSAGNLNPGRKIQNPAQSLLPASKASAPSRAERPSFQAIPGLGEESAAVSGVMNSRKEPSVPNPPVVGAASKRNGYIWNHEEFAVHNEDDVTDELDLEDSLLYTKPLSEHEEWQLGFGAPLHNPGNSSIQNWIQ